LSCGQYTYVQSCPEQTTESLIKCTSTAVSYFGGVPQAIVSDNINSAVTTASKYEPRINLSFFDFASHYNSVVNPARGYAPQDKALVENAVNLSYRRIYYPIRNMTFFSLDDLNKEIQKHLVGYNNMLLQRRSCSRRELFQTLER